MNNKCLVCEKIEFFNKEAKDFIIKTPDGYIFYVRPISFIYLSKKGALKETGRVFDRREWIQQYTLPNDEDLYWKILSAWEDVFHVSAVWTHIGTVLSNNCPHALFYYFPHDKRTWSNLFSIFNSLSRLKVTQKDKENISKFKKALKKKKSSSIAAKK